MPTTGSRVDVESVGLVVERDVAADHRNTEGLARLGQPFDRLPELPHHLGFLRVAEVEVVDDGEGLGSHHRHIEGGLVHKTGRSPPGIQIAQAAVAIGGQGQAPTGPFDSQQSGVMTGPDDGVEEEHVVVLLVDP